MTTKKDGWISKQVAGTPLHYYLERASNINLDLVILKELIAGFPGATSSYQEASEYQPMGVTPMYSLLSNPNIGEMHDVLQYLAETNPLQMCITGGVSDFTPIHIAIQNKGVSAILCIMPSLPLLSTNPSQTSPWPQPFQCDQEPFYSAEHKPSQYLSPNYPPKINNNNRLPINLQ